MKAGRLLHRVAIERPIERQDASGAVIVERWEIVATVWADIRPVRARETYLGAQVLGAVDTVITIRFRPALTEKMRVVHVTEHSGSPQVVFVYDVAGPPVHVAERRRELQLFCVRRSAEGFRSDGVR
jgi:SPP1 family predicted phage head-tail adaptor